MSHTVYRLRFKNDPLPTEAIKRNGRRGELIYEEKYFDPRPWRKNMIAKLLNAQGGYVLPVLADARIIKIKRGGTLITGKELIPISRGSKNVKYDRYDQTWWCLPVLGDLDEEPHAAAPPPASNWRRRAVEERLEEIREMTRTHEL